MSAQNQHRDWRWYDDPYWIGDVVIFLGFMAAFVTVACLWFVIGIGLGWW